MQQPPGTVFGHSTCASVPLGIDHIAIDSLICHEIATFKHSTVYGRLSARERDAACVGLLVFAQYEHLKGGKAQAEA